MFLPTAAAWVTDLMLATVALTVLSTFLFCFSVTVDAGFPFATLEATVAAGRKEGGVPTLLLTEPFGKATVEGERGVIVFCCAGFFAAGLAMDGFTDTELAVEVLTMIFGPNTVDLTATTLVMTGVGDTGLAAKGFVAIALAEAVVESTGLLVVGLAVIASVAAAVRSTGIAVVGPAVEGLTV